MADALVTEFSDEDAGLDAAFAGQDVDFVPDPMVLRAADLFLGGKGFAHKEKMDVEAVWSALTVNLDSILAFFHLLMTREKIPLIDYDKTFDCTNFAALGDLAVAIHPPPEAYRRVKASAEEKLVDADFAALPEAMIADIANELGAVAYQWFPPPSDKSLQGDRKTVATFLMGGLIFGGYAQALGFDHILQTKRARAFLALTIRGPEAPIWGYHQEKELYGRLEAITNADPHLAARDVRLPVTIVPFLLNQGPRSPRDLLERAIRLRDEGDWADYRKWHANMREAWSRGAHDFNAERAVADVAREIGRRFPTGKDPLEVEPLWSREITVRAKAGVQAGGKLGAGIAPPKNGADADGGAPAVQVEAAMEAKAEAGVEADLGKFRISLPNRIRNWFIEAIRFRDHRRVLLRMGLAQRTFDNLGLGLGQLWERN